LTEIEKAQAGFLWKDDPEHLALLAATADLVMQFNATHPYHEAEKENLLKKMLGFCGERVRIMPPLMVVDGKYTSIGDRSYANVGLTIIDDCPVTIGKDCLIGPHVTIATTGHPIAPDHRFDGIYSFPVAIGDNVWIGGHTIVLAGVTIGDNTVIGAGSVVTRDIPANVVAFGNPCRVQREINARDREYYFRGRRFDENP